MADGPELLLKPTHGLSEERRGFLRESAALLVQLRAQPAKRASSARQLLPVAVNALHERKQPLLGRTQLPPSCQLVPTVQSIWSHIGTFRRTTWTPHVRQSASELRTSMSTPPSRSIEQETKTRAVSRPA